MKRCVVYEPLVEVSAVVSDELVIKFRDSAKKIILVALEHHGMCLNGEIYKILHLYLSRKFSVREKSIGVYAQIVAAVAVLKSA